MTSKTALAASAAPRAMLHAPVTASPMLRGPAVAYAPDDGLAALSVADAVAALREPEVAEPESTAEAAPEGESPADEEHPDANPSPNDLESEAEPTAEDLLDPETVIEEQQEATSESDPEAPAIAAPKSWDADEQVLFAKLPPAAQEIILKRETDRDRTVTKVMQEASEARKTAEADLAGLAQLKTQFDEIATRANKVFADKWSNVDWVALAQEADPATYNAWKAQYEAEAGELQRVQQAQADADKVRQQAEQVEFKNYVQGEFAKLSEIAPHLADPTEGAARRTEVTQFLLGRNIPQDAIRQISAEEMAIAYDAMQFRKLKAQGKAAAARPAPPAPRPAPAPARAAAPSAAPATRPTAQRNVETAMNRLAQTGKVDDALAVMRARRGAN